MSNVKTTSRVQDDSQNLSFIPISDEEKLVLSRLLSKIGKHDANDYCLDSNDATVKIAYYAYKARRARSEYFSSELFAEPAWDLLLAAYCFERPGLPLTVSGLGHASECALTTALRWVERLSAAGLLVRQKWQTDGRMTHVCLSERAREQMRRYLERVAANHESAIEKLRNG